MADITQMLQRIAVGQPELQSQLFEAVYRELRQLAVQQMARERPGHTLQPTALVNEAWLRLMASPIAFPGDERGARRYFFAAAAEAMRRILVDRARQKMTQRAGGQLQRQDLDTLEIASPIPIPEVLSVHEVLDQLTAHDPLKAELVKLRYFAGFTNEETAEILQITPRSAEKHWVYAKAWLQHRLQAETN